jgi:hypothetical protein
MTSRIQDPSNRNCSGCEEYLRLTNELRGLTEHGS